MIEKLKELNEKNNVEIKSIKDSSFKTYGKVIESVDFSNLINYMEKNTEIPEMGNIYVPSVKEMEETTEYEKIKTAIYGGMDIQIGYCNGRNSTYNGFEYHKCSEVTIAVTDFMLVLGHTFDIENNTYDVNCAEVFYIEKGTVFEIYQTTLHLAPCKVEDSGFKAVIILLKGTNDINFCNDFKLTEEDDILLFKNKWIICHKDREALVKIGAYVGLKGENKLLYY